MRGKIAHMTSVQNSSPRLLPVAIVLAILLGMFALTTFAVTKGNPAAFDQAATLVFRDQGNPLDPLGQPWLEETGRDITALGSNLVVGLVAIILAICLVLARLYRPAVLLVFAIAGGIAMANIVKLFFDRPRPDFGGAIRVFTSSFPSGHATVSALAFVFIGMLLARLTRSRAIAVVAIGTAVLLTLLIGLSRVYLGVHYPTDVLAGWFLGAAWALACWIGGELLQLLPDKGCLDPARSHTQP
ncbi:MAG: superfamily [Devosia sp.]|nr:superfamily [Devosia sp.]